MIGLVISEQLLSHWDLKKNKTDSSILLLSCFSSCKLCLADLSEGTTSVSTEMETGQVFGLLHPAALIDAPKWGAQLRCLLN